MQLTQQIIINPTKEQEKVLWDLSEKCRLIYNFALEERRNNWKKNKDKPKDDREYIPYIDQQNKLPKTKEKYPEYKWVYSKVLQMILRELDTNFKSFFALRKNGNRDANPPKFRGKKYFKTMCYNQSGFKVKKGFVELSHKHPSNIDLKFKIPKKFVFEEVYQVSIYQKDDDFYISIVYEKEEKEYVDNGKYQAFDLGIAKHTGVNIYGKFVEFHNPRPDKYWQSKIEEVQSKRDHCKRNSRKWKWYDKKLKKMKKKCANQMKDWQHKISRKIIVNTKANTIIVGKLETKKMSRNNKHIKGLNRSLQNTGTISRFVGFLTYKAKLEGKRVIEISEVNTTKMCCVCRKKEDRPLQERTIKCDCGNEIDRDKNSAVNIMERFLSQECSVEEQSSFMEDFLRHTVNDKTRVSQIRFRELVENHFR